MRWLLALIGVVLLAGPALAQTDPRVCDQKDGYITVFEEFVNGWGAAKANGTLVDPELTDIAVWVVKYENRMLAGEPVEKLCREMIEKRAASSFAEPPCAVCGFAK
jgi:hypothetical protein